MLVYDKSGELTLYKTNKPAKKSMFGAPEYDTIAEMSHENIIFDDDRDLLPEEFMGHKVITFQAEAVQNCPFIKVLVV